MPAHIIARIAAVIALFAIAVQAYPARAATPPAAPISPEDLYFGALARLASIPQKPYLSYVMTHVYTRKGSELAADAISIVERRADRRSWNEVTAVTIRSPFGAVGTVSIGRHYLIPDAFLPYHNEDAPQGVLPTFDAPQQPALRTIAAVHVTSSSYAIARVGVDALENCGETVHLSLRPLHNPERYNVRDMWVRASDYRLCKAAFASRLYQEEGKGKSTPTFNTAELDANGLIASYSFFVQFHMILGTYAETNAGTFSNTTWSDDEPSYLFDYSAWKAWRS